MNAENMWNFYEEEYRKRYPEEAGEDSKLVYWNYDGVMAEIENIEAILEAEKSPISEHRGLRCEACKGTGQITYWENQSPLGSGENWPMMMYDVCPVCIEKGKCPQCGYYNGFENKDSPLKCERCGWSDEK